MKYVLIIALFISGISLYSSGFTGELIEGKKDNAVSESFADVEINNTFIIGEGGHFLTITDALESQLVGDNDLLLLNSKFFDEGDLVVTKNVIIKASDSLEENVTIIGKITINSSNVIMDNITISCHNDQDINLAIEVNDGTLTVYEELVILGTASANKSTINNYGKIIVTEN